MGELQKNSRDSPLLIGFYPGGKQQMLTVGQCKEQYQRQEHCRKDGQIKETSVWSLSNIPQVTFVFSLLSTQPCRWIPQHTYCWVM